jgi:hypothetical protein
MHQSQLLNEAGTDTTPRKQKQRPGTFPYKYYDFHADSVQNIFLKA